MQSALICQNPAAGHQQLHACRTLECGLRGHHQTGIGDQERVGAARRTPVEHDSTTTPVGQHGTRTGHDERVVEAIALDITLIASTSGFIKFCPVAYDQRIVIAIDIQKRSAERVDHRARIGDQHLIAGASTKLKIVQRYGSSLGHRQSIGVTGPNRQHTGVGPDRAGPGHQHHVIGGSGMITNCGDCLANQLPAIGDD